MKPQKNNSNEFNLGVAGKRLLLPPYKILIRRPGQGYINPLQMPNITEKDNKDLQDGLTRLLGKSHDV